jgi:hypothetical protein
MHASHVLFCRVEITLIHKIEKPGTLGLKQFTKISPAFKLLFLNVFNFSVAKLAQAVLPCIQSENGFFPTLSTKLSTASVDKKEKCLVYRDLAALRRFYMRCLLHRMIFLILNFRQAFEFPGKNVATAKSAGKSPKATTKTRNNSQLCTAGL